VTSRDAYRLSLAARGDLRTILAQSAAKFGASQRRRYAELLFEAMHRVAEDPTRAGSVDRRSIEPGLRSYPVSLAARRRSAAVHILFYKRADGGVLIVRILHDAMDFARHLSPAGTGSG
jgi:toxin ParE1/3/4